MQCKHLFVVSTSVRPSENRFSRCGLVCHRDGATNTQLVLVVGSVCIFFSRILRHSNAFRLPQI